MLHKVHNENQSYVRTFTADKIKFFFNNIYLVNTSKLINFILITSFSRLNK